MSDAERFVQKFTDVWGAKDPDRYPELFHPEGKLLHPDMKEPLTIDKLPAYIRQILRAMPGLKLVPTDWAAKGETVFIEWTMSGTINGQFVEWRGADRFDLRGDRAIYGVAYFDSYPLRVAADPSVKRERMLEAIGSQAGARG